jgi:hypothetical protein
MTAGEPLGMRAVRALAILNCLVSAVWVLGCVAAQYRVYWFYSGTLYFTYGCSFVLMLSLGMHKLLETYRHAILRLCREQLKVPLTEDHLPPIEVWNPLMTVALLICSALGLLAPSWYMASIIMAKLVTLDTPATETQRLAQELWSTEMGGTIFVLVLISVTLILHLVNLICAAVMYHYHDSLPLEEKEGDSEVPLVVAAYAPRGLNALW